MDSLVAQPELDAHEGRPYAAILPARNRFLRKAAPNVQLIFPLQSRSPVGWVEHRETQQVLARMWIMLPFGNVR
jgi:hypothetical protein